MPSLFYETDAEWTNYHFTRGAGASGSYPPAMTITELATIAAGDAIQASGLERFAAIGEKVFEHLAHLERKYPDSPGQPKVAAGMVGRAWSFAPLIGTAMSQLQCTGMSSVTRLAPDERDLGCPIDLDDIVLAAGGTTMSDIATFAEARGRSLMTSGSYLGPTIAGGFATSSHGSRLGYGGIQNMVLGMHLIVGSGEHVWLERKSCPVLSPAGLSRLVIAGTAPRHIANDDLFEDALVHLGAMGVVNGVAIRTAENTRFALLRRTKRLGSDMLDAIGQGDFAAIAKRLNCAIAPAFYELTLNPQQPFDDDALHTMYIPTRRTGVARAGPAATLFPADAFAQLGSTVVATNRTAQRSPQQIDELVPAQTTVPPWVLRELLDGADSGFSYYRALKQFETIATPFDPDDPTRKPYSWSELHAGAITGDKPGALYNASFAIPLERVPDAVKAVSAAVSDLLPSFVFTLRFVEGATGTLAFTRFEKTAVIEIDGLSPLICMMAKAQADPADPDSAVFIKALDELAATLPTGAHAVRHALDGAGIPFSMHWAKLGDLDKAKVYNDFGHPLDPDSLIKRWREAREQLLTPFGRRVFWNDAVVTYGLLDP